MLDLAATYEQLARPWTPEQLAAHYREANNRGKQARGPEPEDADGGPVSLLASAIPRFVRLSVAAHVLHVLPSTTGGEVAPQLLGTIDENATALLHLCHRALELDGRKHDYMAGEWLPAVYDSAAPLLEQSSLRQEPPSVVEHAQEAVRWLACAIISLDQDAPDAAAAIADCLGRLLALYVFAEIARSNADAPDQ
jgi:hypothetical protein